MPKRKKKTAARPKAKNPTPAVPSADEAQFVSGVLTRGEAAPRDGRGKLAAGVTHEIVRQEPGKLPEIKRARFSITG
jgi:hypothetical protein